MYEYWRRRAEICPKWPSRLLGRDGIESPLNADDISVCVGGMRVCGAMPERREIEMTCFCEHLLRVEDNAWQVAQALSVTVRSDGNDRVRAADACQASMRVDV